MDVMSDEVVIKEVTNVEMIKVAPSLLCRKNLPHYGGGSGGFHGQAPTINYCPPLIRVPHS